MYNSVHSSIRPNVTHESIGLIGFSLIASLAIGAFDKSSPNKSIEKQGETQPTHIRANESDTRSPLAENEMPRGFRKVLND